MKSQPENTALNYREKDLPCPEKACPEIIEKLRELARIEFLVYQQKTDKKKKS